MFTTMAVDKLKAFLTILLISGYARPIRQKMISEFHVLKNNNNFKKDCATKFKNFDQFQN